MSRTWWEQKFDEQQRLREKYASSILSGTFPAQGERFDIPMVNERTKHDGDLGGDIGNNATVTHYDYYGKPAVLIDGGYGMDDSRAAILDAKQALELLAFLFSEQETLEQLAKEQA